MDLRPRERGILATTWPPPSRQAANDALATRLAYQYDRPNHRSLETSTHCTQRSWTYDPRYPLCNEIVWFFLPSGTSIG